MVGHRGAISGGSAKIGSSPEKSLSGTSAFPWSAYWANRLLTINYTSTQFTFKFKLPSSNSVILRWGDGTTESVVGEDSTLITKVSNYTSQRVYRFGILGDYDKITYIDISGQTFVSGDISVLYQLTTVRTPQLGFMFDDGYVQDKTVLEPIFTARGHVANSAIITGVIGTPGKLSAAQIISLQNAGWEIVSHTISHPDLTTLSAGDLHHEIANSKAALEALGCVVNSLCYPNGAHNATVEAETLTHYRAGWASVSYYPTTGGFILYPIDIDALERHASADYTGEEWIDKVDESYDVWKNAAIVFYNHGVYMDETFQGYLVSLLDYMDTKGLKMRRVNDILDTILAYKDCEIYASGTSVSFNSQREWHNTSQTIDISDCNLTSQEVDDALIGFSHYCHLCTIKLAGNNSRRTTASNSALATLIANGNAVDVNDPAFGWITNGLTVAHYDAHNISNITKNVSNLVAQWNDKIGGVRNLIQAVDTKKGVWSSEGVTFSDVGPDYDSMKTAGFTYNQPEYIWLVLKQNSWNNGFHILDGNGVNSGFLSQRTATPKLRVFAGAPSSDSADLAIGETGIVKIIFNGANSSFQINDHTPITGDFGTNNMGGITIANRGDAAAGSAGFTLREAIFRTADDPDISSYLKAKYSL